MEKLSDYVKYDSESPTGLSWIVDKNYNAKKGDYCGTLDNKGYYCFTLNNKKYKNHRVVYMLFNGEIPSGFQIDHIDRVKSNNKIENLRLVTQSENQRNIDSPMITFRASPSGSRLMKSPSQGRLILQYRTIDGKQKSKSLSIRDYGYEYALQLLEEEKIKILELHYPTFTKEITC